LIYLYNHITGSCILNVSSMPKRSAPGDDTEVYLESASSSGGKFWGCRIEGATTYVTFGKVGTAGVTQLKNHGDADTAVKFMSKMIAEKSKKGYSPADAPDNVGAPAPAAAPAPGPKSALEVGTSVPKPAAKKAKVSAPAKTATAAPAPAPATSASASATASGVDLSSDVFCFTGFRDKDLEAKIRRAGGSVAGSMTKAVTVVVRSTGADESTKVEAARAKGLRVLTRMEVEDLIVSYSIM
jgi:predicted DNA-binding WGR domain protein